MVDKSGNGVRTGADSYAVAPEGPQRAEPWLARPRVQRLPHGTAVWKAAAAPGSDTGVRLVAEVDARRRRQATP